MSSAPKVKLSATVPPQLPTKIHAINSELALRSPKNYPILMTVDEIQKAAVRLPLGERGDLIATLGQPSYDVDDQEVAKRMDDLESGRVEDISHTELLSRLKHLPKS